MCVKLQRVHIKKHYEELEEGETTGHKRSKHFLQRVRRRRSGGTAGRKETKEYIGKIAHLLKGGFVLLALMQFTGVSEVSYLLRSLYRSCCSRLSMHFIIFNTNRAQRCKSVYVCLKLSEMAIIISPLCLCHGNTALFVCTHALPLSVAVALKLHWGCGSCAQQSAPGRPTLPQSWEEEEEEE